MSTHTATPWFYTFDGREVYIVDTHGDTVLDLGTQLENSVAAHDLEANAKFIIRACNAHDELVAALDFLVKSVEPILTNRGFGYFGAIERAQKILAKLKD